MSTYLVNPRAMQDSKDFALLSAQQLKKRLKKRRNVKALLLLVVMACLMTFLTFYFDMYTPDDPYAFIAIAVIVVIFPSGIIIDHANDGIRAIEGKRQSNSARSANVIATPTNSYIYRLTLDKLTEQDVNKLLENPQAKLRLNAMFFNGDNNHARWLDESVGTRRSDKDIHMYPNSDKARDARDTVMRTFRDILHDYLYEVPGYYAEWYRGEIARENAARIASLDSSIEATQERTQILEDQKQRIIQSHAPEISKPTD